MAVVTAPEPFLDERKALACVHCGLCLGACPTYLETGNENDSPRGRIYLMRALQAGRLPAAEVVEHIDRCLGCRACEIACPSGVQYGALLETTRDHLERHHDRPIFQRLLRHVAIERVFPFPERMHLALLPARLVKWLGLDRVLPRFLREPLALVPEDCEAVELPEISPATTGGTRGRVGFVSGCVMSVMFGRTHRNTIRVLNAAGYEVVTPPAQACCGALFSHGGNLEQARISARHNLAVFERHSLDAIIINAAGCGSTLKEYGHLLEGDPQWHERAARFSAKVKDFSEFLASTGFSLSPISRLPFPDARVTFHDACHLAHAQRITKQPRELVKAVAGDRYVELPEADVCCGSAGSYNLTEPEMAARLQSRKTANIAATGAEIVVTTNPGCLLQIQAGLRQAGHPHVRAMHLADYLAEALFE